MDWVLGKGYYLGTIYLTVPSLLLMVIYRTGMLFLLMRRYLNFGNTWSIGRDLEYFLDPEKFNPKRWLKEDGQLREDLYLRGWLGQYLATP